MSDPCIVTLFPDTTTASQSNTGQEGEVSSDNLRGEMGAESGEIQQYDMEKEPGDEEEDPENDRTDDEDERNTEKDGYCSSHSGGITSSESEGDEGKL